MRITKKDVFWVFVLVIWVYNAFALLDVLGIMKIEGVIFYTLVTTPPLFLYLYTIASPPEPDVMTIIKFGGISVQNADAVKNISEIIRNANSNLVVVISAMGKMTNKFEYLVNLYTSKAEFASIVTEIKQYHFNIINELFTNKQNVYSKVNTLFNELQSKLNEY